MNAEPKKLAQTAGGRDRLVQANKRLRDDLKNAQETIASLVRRVERLVRWGAQERQRRPR